MATIEPVKVMAPTNTETTMDTRATGVPASRAAGERCSQRHQQEDMPPQPLNKATVSGIDVIGTR